MRAWLPGWKPTVRLHLLMIALAALLPLWALAGHIAGRMADAENERLAAAAREMSQGVAFVLEREILGLRGELSALATSPALRDGRYDVFHQQARAVLEGEEGRIRLTDRQGRVLVDTAIPFEDWADEDSLPVLPESPQRSGVSNLRMDPENNVYRVDIVQAVAVPSGPPRLFVSAEIAPQRIWSRPLELVDLPPGWIAVIADAEGRLIARLPPIEGMIGHRASSQSATQQAVASGEASGWLRGRSRDRVPLYTAWHRVVGTEWVVLIGLPAEQLDGNLLRTLSPVLVMGGLMLLVFTLALAFWVDRRIALPLGRLGRMASAFGRGAALPPFPPSGLFEIDSAARALSLAAAEREALEAERITLTARLQTVLETTTDSVLVLDRDGIVLYINGRARAQAGQRELIGRPLREGFPGWDSGPFGAVCRRAAQEGTPQGATAFHPALGRWISADVYPSTEGLTLFFRDVTDQRAAEAALRDSEARLKAVMDNVPVGVLLAEAPSGRILLGNRRLEDILRHPVRLSAGIAQYREDFEAYHADGRRAAGAELPIGRTLLTGLPASGEYHYRRGDGSMVWLRIAAAPVRDAQGTLKGAVVAITDIDAERRAGEALRESELRFRTLAEAIPQVVWSSLPDGRIDYVNPRLQDFTGMAPAVAMQALAQIIHPEDQRRAERAWQRALRKGEAFSTELRLRRMEGGWRWCMVRALPARAPDGSIRRWIGAVTDVSDLVEAREALARQVSAQAASREAAVQAAMALAASESRFRRFAEASPDVMWMVSPDWQTMEFVSPAFERIWGIALERMFENPAAGRDAIHPADQERYRQAMEAAGREGGYDVEYRILRPDGGMRWIRDVSFPILDTQGIMTRRGGLARDITAAKAAEARQALLLGELNHRVKNTLATVHSLALQTARTAGTSAEAIPRFLNDFQARLLTLSRGHDLLTARTWRGATLEDTARAALAPWQGDAEPGGEPHLLIDGPSVWLAPRQALGLALALHELATNAIKHGALSRPEGQVEVTWRGDPDGMVRLTWQERGGPPVRPPSRRGFGSRMLERGLPAELGPGSGVEMDYAEAGFMAEIRFRPVSGPQVEEESA